MLFMKFAAALWCAVRSHCKVASFSFLISNNNPLIKQNPSLGHPENTTTNGGILIALIRRRSGVLWRG